jgi:hypothetical protein
VALGGADTYQEDVIHVFTYQGEDFYMPAYVPPALGLQALHRFRTEGEALAVSWLLERVLGSRAYTVLIGAEDVTKDQLLQVMRNVQAHVMGSVENEGN